jgi:hypothetical protein
MTYTHSLIEDPSLLASDAEETAYETLAAELGWDAIEEGENPDRFLRPGDFDLAEPDFASDDEREAYNAECDRLTREAQEHYYMFN